MEHDHNHGPLPRINLVICGGAVLIALVAAAAGRITHSADSRPTAAPIAARDLLFQDRADGAVAIFDARDLAKPIEVVAPGTGYFLRATMRGLARQRLRQEADRDVPFRLTEWADGRLTLEDPTTNRRVDMEAFGKDNEQVFADLIMAKS